MSLLSIVSLVLVLALSIDEGLVQHQLEVLLKETTIARDGAVECRLEIRHCPRNPDLLSIHGLVVSPCFSGDLVVAEVVGVDQRYVLKSPLVAAAQYAPSRHERISPRESVVANIQISHFLTEEWHALPDMEKKTSLASAAVVLYVHVDEVAYERVRDLRRFIMTSTADGSFRRVRLISKATESVDFEK